MKGDSTHTTVKWMKWSRVKIDVNVKEKHITTKWLSRQRMNNHPVRGTLPRNFGGTDCAPHWVFELSYLRSLEDNLLT